MIRAAIYARFSTDLQNDQSVDDQLYLCRQHAQREGMTVTAEFSDKAVSGATLYRKGVQNLISLARQRMVDVIIVEALDRLSRSMADLAGLHDELKFLGIRLIAVHEGEANTMLVGMKGLFAQMFREDNVKKVRRGMQGRIIRGKSAGGLAYGYKADRFNRAELLIVEEEAQVVRHIFSDFAQGISPRLICHSLNERHIRSPRGKIWGPSALIGWEERGSGILRNSIYMGRPIWNKNQMMKDPSTGKRVPRRNSVEDHVQGDVPHLRIVSDDLFEAVQRELRKNAHIVKERGVGQAKRAVRLLSGIIKCGACGSGMPTKGKDKSGRVRIQCARHTNSGDCPDPRSFYLDLVESLVLDTLSYHLTEPDLLAAYAKAYQDKHRRLNSGKRARREEVTARISKLEDDNARLLDMLLEGQGTASAIDARMKHQEAERLSLLAELAALEEPDNVVELHPSSIRKAAEAITTIRALFGTHQIDGKSEAAQTIRAMMESVTVHHNPSSEKGLRIELKGRFSAFQEQKSPPVMAGFQRVTTLSGVTMVAEEGLEPPTRGL